MLKNKGGGHSNENESAYPAAVIERSNVPKTSNVFAGISLTIIDRGNMVV